MLAGGRGAYPGAMAGNQACDVPSPAGAARDATTAARFDTVHDPDVPQYSEELWRISTAACAVVIVLVIFGTVSGMTRQSPLTMAATAAALTVALTGIGRHLLGHHNRRGKATLRRLTAVGLAGVVLAGLVPNGSGYLVVFIALLAIGMDLPPKAAFPAAIAIFATSGVAFLLGTNRSLASLVSNEVGEAFLFAIGMFIRSTRVSQTRARAAQARAEELLAQLQGAQAAHAQAAILTERTRLAREIHDILAHALSGLVLALDTAELLAQRAKPGDETMVPVLEQVARAQRIARDGLADTRRAVSALRGDELPGPGLLGQLVAGTAEATGIGASLTVSGQQRPLPPEVGLAIYRTAQEALINSAKYAGRDGNVLLHLTYQPDGVRLAVEDARPDGAAAPAGPTSLTFGGYGLAGMRERAELLGGELTAGPTESGFRVLLRLPADPVDLAAGHAADLAAGHAGAS
jgi:signal transduction histidine kinase